MKVNQEHWNCFLDFAETHPEVITNKFYGPTGRAKATHLWTNIVHKLNGLGYGSKNIEEWRKAITDWKCKVKAKAAKLKKELNATGGGAVKQPPLNNWEERLLQILGRKGIEGDNVPELGLPLDEDVQDKKSQINEEMESLSSTCETGTTSQDVGDVGILPPKRRRLSTGVRRRPHSERLLKVSEDSVAVLRSIDETLKTQNKAILSIAESFKNFVEYLKKQ